jgi:hypothetical protein
MKREQPPYQAMDELLAAVERCFAETREPEALSNRLKEVLIDQSGKKIFDSRDEKNRKVPLP